MFGAEGPKEATGIVREVAAASTQDTTKQSCFVKIFYICISLAHRANASPKVMDVYLIFTKHIGFVGGRIPMWFVSWI